MLQFGQKVEINYAGFLEDGTEFVNTWLSPDSVSVTIGQSGLLPAFEQALVDMQLPCLDYFLAHFLDSFRLTLDELE